MSFTFIKHEDIINFNEVLQPAFSITIPREIQVYLNGYSAGGFVWGNGPKERKGSIPTIQCVYLHGLYQSYVSAAALYKIFVFDGMLCLKDAAAFIFQPEVLRTPFGDMLRTPSKNGNSIQTYRKQLQVLETKLKWIKEHQDKIRSYHDAAVSLVDQHRGKGNPFTRETSIGIGFYTEEQIELASIYCFLERVKETAKAVKGTEFVYEEYDPGLTVNSAYARILYNKVNYAMAELDNHVRALEYENQHVDEFEGTRVMSLDIFTKLEEAVKKYIEGKTAPVSGRNRIYDLEANNDTPETAKGEVADLDAKVKAFEELWEKHRSTVKVTFSPAVLGDGVDPITNQDLLRELGLKASNAVKEGIWELFQKGTLPVVSQAVQQPVDHFETLASSLFTPKPGAESTADKILKSYSRGSTIKKASEQEPTPVAKKRRARKPAAKTVEKAPDSKSALGQRKGRTVASFVRK